MNHTLLANLASRCRRAVLSGLTRALAVTTVLTGMTVATSWASPALAQTPAQAVTFDVTVIEGSKGEAVRIDPPLEPLRKELEKLVPFKIFRLVNTYKLTISAGEKRPVKLPDGTDAEIAVSEVLPGAPRKVRYSLRLQHSRQTRVAAPGARFVDAIPAGDKVLAVSIQIL